MMIASALVFDSGTFGIAWPGISAGPGLGAEMTARTHRRPGRLVNTRLDGHGSSQRPIRHTGSVALPDTPSSVIDGFSGEAGKRMAKSVLERLQPLATELAGHLARARQLRQQGLVAQAREAEEAAGRIMGSGPLKGWLVLWFRRKGVSPELAEDLTQDVWCKLISAGYEVKTNAYALIVRMAQSRLMDFGRSKRREPIDPGPPMPGDADQSGEPGWVEEPTESEAVDDALVDCVRRRLAAFASVSGSRANLLLWVAEGLTARQIACIVFDKPIESITAKDEGAVRDRIYQARRQAVEYFKECKE